MIMDSDHHGSLELQNLVEKLGFFHERSYTKGWGCGVGSRPTRGGARTKNTCPPTKRGGQEPLRWTRTKNATQRRDAKASACYGGVTRSSVPCARGRREYNLTQRESDPTCSKCSNMLHVLHESQIREHTHVLYAQLVCVLLQ